MISEKDFNDLKEFISNDAVVQKLWEKTTKGTATYKDAELYADKINGWFAKRLGDKYSSFTRFEGDTIKDINDMIQKCYTTSVSYSLEVQSNINSRANLKIKSIAPKMDESRVTNLVDKMNTEGRFLIDKPMMRNIAKTAVHDTLKTNATFQASAGLVPVMIRHLGSNGCCEWCKEMAGEYRKGSEPDGFWQFHTDCDCWIDYKVNKRTDRVSFKTSGGRLSKVTE